MGRFTEEEGYTAGGGNREEEKKEIGKGRRGRIRERCGEKEGRGNGGEGKGHMMVTGQVGKEREWDEIWVAVL